MRYCAEKAAAWLDLWERRYASRWVERGGKYYPLDAPVNEPPAIERKACARLEAARRDPVLLALLADLGPRYGHRHPPR